MGQKLKLSVTLDERIVSEVDRLAGARRNRSATIERLLRGVLRRRRREQLDQAIEAYYSARERDEVAEDEAWAALGDDTVRREW